MKHLYLHHVAKLGTFAVEMYDFLYHSYSETKLTALFGH